MIKISVKISEGNKKYDLGTKVSIYFKTFVYIIKRNMISIKEHPSSVKLQGPKKLQISCLSIFIKRWIRSNVVSIAFCMLCLKSTLCIFFCLAHSMYIVYTFFDRAERHDLNRRLWLLFFLFLFPPKKKEGRRKREWIEKSWF